MKNDKTYNGRDFSAVEITLEEFTQKIKNLDWFYNMSDDHRAYNRGREACAYYRDMAEAFGPEWVEAYKAESAKHVVRF
tara:strand:- start:864 stop:1100 length:237 start_codon:yes stop_codon:yes gene_type:complete